MAINNYNSNNSAAAGWPGGFREKYPNGGAFLTCFKTSHNESKKNIRHCKVY